MKILKVSTRKLREKAIIILKMTDTIMPKVSNHTDEISFTKAQAGLLA